MSALFALIMFVMPYTIALGGYTLTAFAIFGLFFCEGCNFALYLPVTIQLFGHKHASANYGFIFPLYSISVMITIVTLSLVHANFKLATFTMGMATLVGTCDLITLRIRVLKLLKNKENNGFY